MATIQFEKMANTPQIRRARDLVVTYWSPTNPMDEFVFFKRFEFEK